ncbi:MAG: imidazole glycerol phosphate synthase subunit HisH [Bdellovibrionales bacterium]|nr:imidazole glycerol phosphate synthase subunit HisH [Bdellovibrionales bacterium]
MTVAILKYNAGNTKSVALALHRLGAEAVVTDDPLVLRASSKVIVPGVGAARSAMEYLRGRKLDQVIKSLTQPVLGVCLGQQLFCSFSEEEDTECLDIIPLQVERFRTPKKVPHMGWNKLTELRGELFQDLPEEAYAYFVHSYRAPVSPEFTVASAQHGEVFSAALRRSNFFATQFHPEKSGKVGEQILRNFLAI